jgi:hypothetical protein
MHSLKLRYPASRSDRKLHELDQLASTYTEKLCAYLPCLDLAHAQDVVTANQVLNLLAEIATVQQRLDGDTITPEQEQAEKAALAGRTGDPLGNLERTHMIELIREHGIFVAKDENSNITYITHPSLQGKAQALNEREIYDIVMKIASPFSCFIV